MEIYYSSSLWYKGNGPGGLPQRTNWWFEYEGTIRCIPAVYRFRKGIVFDIITLLDESKLHAFFEKYEALEEALSPLDQSCAEQEHPYQTVPIKEIWIDGKQTDMGYSSSSSISIPWTQQDAELTLIKQIYSYVLKDTTCFACQRFCVPYPKTASLGEKILRFFRRNKITGIRLSTQPVPRFYPLDIHFQLSDKNEQKKISFVHSKTGITHTLYFQSPELLEIPMAPGENHSFYTVQAMYEIDPPLPSGDSLQFNSSIQYTESSKDMYSPTEASSIGIIGGADGPTAIFITAKDKEKTVPRGLHGLPLHSCFSVPGFNKEAISGFHLEGINIKHCDSKEYDFQ